MSREGGAAVLRIVGVVAVLLSPMLAAGAAPSWGLVWEAPTGLGPDGVGASALADIDGDGGPELVLRSISRDPPWHVVVLDGTSGATRWRQDFGARPIIRAADLDDREPLELLVAHGDRVEVLDASGHVVRGVRLSATVGDVAVGPVGGDGVDDIVCVVDSEDEHLLVVLSGLTLETLWTVDATPDDSRFGVGFARPVVRDLDGDGRGEVLAAENTDVLTLVGSDGERVWATRLGERTRYVPLGALSSCPVVADLTGGGSEVAAVGCFAGALLLLDLDDGEVIGRMLFGGESHAAFAKRRGVPGFIRKLIAETGEPVNELAVVELGGGPGRELAFGCSDGNVYAVSPGVGRTLWSEPVDGQVYEPPDVFDATGDGTPDLLVWHEKGVALLDGTTGNRLSGLPPFADVRGVRAGDIDGDGRLEVIVIDRRGTRATAWSTGLPVPPAETASDGRL